MSYTKGEWEILEANNDTLFIRSDRGYLQVCEYIKTKDDARLIAAAPAMYEAIKLYHKHQEGTRGHFCTECWAKLEDALAKAEGK